MSVAIYKSVNISANENYKSFEKLVADTGGTYAFDGETSVKGIGMIFQSFNLFPHMTVCRGVKTASSGRWFLSAAIGCAFLCGHFMAS